ncbi:MAG: paraquat-inducible protein A [Candidatus Aminicenantes bacterium]|jgi:paraquat-inducible protein A
MPTEKITPKKRRLLPRPKVTIWGHIITHALLWISPVTLAIGIFAPVMTFKKLIFYKNTFSIYSGLVTLFKEAEYILFLIIFVFTILFPLVKISLLFLIHYRRSWSEERRIKILHYLGLISKWSMLDVFIVAMLVVIVRLGITGRVDARWGIYVFAAAVILSTLSTLRIARKTH